MGEFSDIELAVEMERRIMARTDFRRFIEQLSPETVPAKHHNLLLAKLIEIEHGRGGRPLPFRKPREQPAPV